jgi:DNA-binding transcriptional regulator YhcF (GntR family)
MANDLRVSVSTVSRALVKLTSFGLITYLTGRGRSARTFILRAYKDDGMDRFRRKAKATIRKWSEASKRRISRLQSNLAPYYLEGGVRRTDSLGMYLQYVISKDAKISHQWTPEELRDAGII